MRPSANTNVMLVTDPRTHDSVQSPSAMPDTTAWRTSGISQPLAIRLRGPTMSLNGYGSTTASPFGTRPIRPDSTVAPVSTALRGTV